MASHKHKPRVCFILNIAPLYRRAIFNILDHNNDIDFFFMSGNISYDIDALMDLRELSGYKGTLKNIYKSKKLIWQRGVFKALWRGYDAFILTGNPGIRSNWIFMLLARLMGKKVYLWSHGMYGNEKMIQLMINKTYMRLSSGLFLYGNYAINLLLKEGFKSNKMTVVYNSLDYYNQKKERRKYVNAGFMRNYFGNDFPVIAFVGRLTKQKSLNTLVDAVGILKASDCDVNIIFVGSGECEAELKQRVIEACIDDRVWFYGECYDEQMIATVFQNSSLCVSPGNVGLTAIHALSYGIPVITHNRFKQQMPEAESVKRGVNGDFFKYGDPVDLAESIERWVKITGDKNKSESLRERCYKIVDEVYNPQNQNNIFTSRLLRDVR